MANEQQQQYDLLQSESCPEQKCVRVKERPLTFRVRRNPQIPKELLQNKSEDKIDEVLVLERMDAPGCDVMFEVFIDFPAADEKTTANVQEYVGSIYLTTQRTTDARFSIRENLKMLKLENAPELLVTIVPKGTEKDVAVPFKGAEIVYT